MTTRCVLVSLAVCLTMGSAAFADPPPPAASGAKEPFLALDPGGHTALIGAVLFTPDGRRVVTASQDKTIRVWDVATGETVQVIRPPIDRGWEGALFTAAVSPDGRMLAVAGYNVPGRRWGRIHLIALTEGRLVRVLEGHLHSITCLAFSRDGRRLASGSRDRSAIVWEVETGRYERIFQGHTGEVWNLAFSPDGRFLATASHDRTGRIWSVATGRATAVLGGHLAPVHGIDWSPDGRTIATAGWDRRVLLWNSDGTGRLAYNDLGNEIWSVAFAPDSRRLLLTQGGDVNSPLHCSVLDLVTGRELVRFPLHSNLPGHTNSVQDGTFSPDGTLAVTTGGNNDETYVWDTATGAIESRLNGRGLVPWSARWSADGRSIAWGNQKRGRTVDAQSPIERTFRLGDLRIGPPPEGDYRGPWHAWGPLSLSKTGPNQVSILRGGAVQAVFQLPAEFPENTVRCFTLLPDDRAAVGTDFDFYLIDTRTGRLLRTFKGHNAEVWAVAPSPDGRFLLSASADRTLRVWSPDRDEPLVSLFITGKETGNEWIAWTPEGYYACSGGGERLMGWHVNNGPRALASFYPAVRFRDSLYRPDVLGRILEAGSVERALRLADAARGVAPRPPLKVSEVLPPEVEVVSPAPDARLPRGHLVVKARARSLGAHPVIAMRLLLNGRPFKGRAGLKPVADPKPGEVAQDWDIELDPGRHRLTVLAQSAVSEGSSREVAVTYLGDDPEDSGVEGRHALHVLLVGISAYPADMRLNYAAKDARDLEAVIKGRCHDLYKEIHVTALLDAGATRQAILQELGALRSRASQLDDCLVYFAGHGEKDDQGGLYLLPVEADVKNLVGTAIPDSELKRLLAGIPATHLVVLIDACHAGSQGVFGLIDDMVRDFLRPDCGVMVLAAASSRAMALESHGDRRSFFSLALIEGLDGKADSYHDGLVMNNEIDTYVVNRVRDETRGQQVPTGDVTRQLLPFPLSKLR